MASAQHDAWVDRVEIVGARRTRPKTLLELLPRRPPTTYSAAELREFARRASNLAIFDLVELDVAGTALLVRVREKWTLAPELDFATGKTPRDLSAMVSATESNLLGTATTLALSVYRERRGFGGAARFEEHVYRRRRWARALEASYGNTQLSFPDDVSWFANYALACAWLTSPPVVSDRLRYEVGTIYKREWLDDVTGSVRPPDGHYVSVFSTLIFDQYQWHDLTPHGVTASIYLSPGVFVGPGLAEPRHLVELNVKGALRLAQYTALMARFSTIAYVRGNPNHNVQLGSFLVRGMTDGWYYNWLQSVLNIELRQAIPLVARWALQAVWFADMAGFEQMDAHGRRAHADFAFSGGFGMRLVPTWLSGLVLRFDTAWAVTPERAFMMQYGLTQYF